MIWLTRASILLSSPSPSTTVVLSFVTSTLFAVPNISIEASFNSNPKSSVITVAPVNIAKSSNIALRRSPKPGALTATAVNVPLMRFNTIFVNASPSTSSATIKIGRLDWTTCSNKGSISWNDEIFLSVTKIYGLSNSAIILSESVTIYGDW